jgi:two-component system chemotaxis response regulator CheY
MKVLIVDDYGTMRRIIRDLLSQIGYDDVDEASTGREALEKLRATQYGLVISDWHMEPMTGYDLLKEVRADERLRETPFIIVTAEAQRDKLAAAHRVGFDDCLVKPFDATTLLSTIAGAVTHH